jgi:hypothetical protein
MRLLNNLSLAAVTVLGASAAFEGARADTRIFSVQTDRPGVTITAVQRNGQALPETGRSGGRTFFEINDGSNTVPCSNQLAFAASNGQRLEFMVDLCAHNWQVTLPLGTAQAPPQPAAPTSLTIYTDDPNISIDEVYLDKQPMSIAGRQGNAVAIALPPGQVKCERDLGLALADGRRIARTVNVCVPNGAISVALNETATPPPPGPSISVPAPAVPPPPPPVAAAPPPTFTGTPEVIENLVWAFDADALRATLAYVLPNSDQIEFSASCNRGSREVEVSLERSPPELQPGVSVPVTATAGTFAKTYSATGSDINALTGLSHPEMTVSVDDPLWQALIHGEYLVFQTGSAPPYALSLRGSSAAGRPFVEACSSSQFAGGPPPGFPPFPGAQIGGDYPCPEEGTLASQKSNVESSLTLRNSLGQPVQLFWLDYDGRRRPYQSIGPGETYVQPTFFTHPWVVADLSGRCIAIYYGARSDRQIVIGP